MPTLPREVREERLRRFLAQQSKLTADVARMQDLYDRIVESEKTETDREKLYQFGDTKKNLTRTISEAQASLLRTLKSIDHEKELLARYDTEGGDTEGDDAERVDEPGTVESAGLIRDAEGVLATSASAEAATPNLILREAIEKIGVREYGAVTLHQVELLLKYYAYLSNHAHRSANEDGLKNTLETALGAVDVKLDALRRVWNAMRPS